MAEDRTNRIPVPAQVPLRNKSNQALAIRRVGAISPIAMKIVENMVVLQKDGMMTGTGYMDYKVELLGKSCVFVEKNNK